MLIIGPSGSGKTNTLLHLIDKFHPIDKIYLYAKDTNEEKYQYLINKREQAGIKNCVKTVIKNCVWLFYYFNFERSYDVLNSKSPCFLLN